jgi:hypothetical protein
MTNMVMRRRCRGRPSGRQTFGDERAGLKPKLGTRRQKLEGKNSVKRGTMVRAPTIHHALETEERADGDACIVVRAAGEVNFISGFEA